jgi:hypothetical protein
VDQHEDLHHFVDHVGNGAPRLDTTKVAHCVQNASGSVGIQQGLAVDNGGRRKGKQETCVE